MPVPKKRRSKGRANRGRNSHYFEREVGVVKTKDGKAYKRPHVEEKITV